MDGSDTSRLTQRREYSAGNLADCQRKGPAVTLHVELVVATMDDRRIVERLLQLYEYDVSDLMDQDVDADGVYRVGDPDVTWSLGRHAFLITVDGKLAGF